MVDDVACEMINLVRVQVEETGLALSLTSFLPLRTFWMAGTTYAPVLPLPVLALANTSFPPTMRGMALDCTSVGVVNPWSASARRIRASTSVVKREEEKLSVGSRSVSSIVCGGAIACDLRR